MVEANEGGRCPRPEIYIFAAWNVLHVPVWQSIVGSWSCGGDNRIAMNAWMCQQTLKLHSKQKGTGGFEYRKAIYLVQYCVRRAGSDGSWEKPPHSELPEHRSHFTTANSTLEASLLCSRPHSAEGGDDKWRLPTVFSQQPLS